MENEKKIVVLENDKEIEIEVLDTFSLNNYPGKKYILFSKGEKDDKYETLYLSEIIEAEDEICLYSIDNEEEYKEAEKYINNVIKEGEVNE